MSDIGGSIFILNSITSDMLRRSKVIKGLTKDLNNANTEDEKDMILGIWKALYFSDIIDIKSFQDEYNDYFGVRTEIKYKKRVLKLKQILKPLMTKVSLWRDIEKARNIAAHNKRIQKNSYLSVFSDNSIYNWNIPTGHAELFFISSLLNIISSVIKIEFWDEYEAYSKQLHNNEYQSRKQINMTLQTAKAELHILCEALNKDLEKEGKPYKLNISTEIDNLFGS